MRRIAAAAVVVTAVTGCGDDNDVDVGAAGDGETTTSAPAEEDQPGAPVEVTAVNYEFQGLPDTVPAGTVLSLVNESATELHEIGAFRLDDDEERSVEELVALPQGEFDPGIPAMVLWASPGGEQIAAVGDGTLTEPGRYALICSVPTGADPEAYLKAAREPHGSGPPKVEGGPPHFTQGMYAELTVE